MSHAEEAVAFLRRLYERRAGRVERLPFGAALITEELPLAHDLNFVLVDRWDGDAAGLAAASDAAQGRLGFPHRRTVVLDQPLVARLWPDLRSLDLGFASRYLLMAHVREGERGRNPAVRVVELSSADPGGPRTFGVRAGEAVVASATLFCESGVALIEDVETSEAHRGRGYGSALVLHAVAEARAAGATPIFLPTAEHDWPQHLYRRLGFETVALELVFGRPA